MSDPATPELLDRWLRGDPEAAAAIYQEYFQRIERFARTRTKDTLEAREVAAESFARGLEGVRKGLRPDRFTRWLFGIARNVAADRPPEQPLLEPPASKLPSPRTLAMRRDIGDVLQKALDRLAPTYREVVRLQHHEHLGRGEIADRLGIPRATVDRRFARAHAALRREVRKHVTSLVRPRVTWSRIEPLRPSFRTALVHHHLDGLSIEDTALRLDVPVDTVRARLSAAYEQVPCHPEDDFTAARDQYRRSV